MPDENIISWPVETIVRFVDQIHKSWVFRGDKSFQLATLNVVIIDLICLRFGEHGENLFNIVIFSIENSHHLNPFLKKSILINFEVRPLVLNLKVGKNLKLLQFILWIQFVKEVKVSFTFNNDVIFFFLNFFLEDIGFLKNVPLNQFVHICFANLLSGLIILYFIFQFCLFLYFFLQFFIFFVPLKSFLFLLFVLMRWLTFNLEF